MARQIPGISTATFCWRICDAMSIERERPTSDLYLGRRAHTRVHVSWARQPRPLQQFTPVTKTSTKPEFPSLRRGLLKVSKSVHLTINYVLLISHTNYTTVVIPLYRH